MERRNCLVLGDGEILASVCGLEEGGNELQMSGFEFVNMFDYGKMRSILRIYSYIEVIR